LPEVVVKGNIPLYTAKQDRITIYPMFWQQLDASNFRPDIPVSYPFFLVLISQIFVSRYQMADYCAVGVFICQNFQFG
jgi:hypothetical protein